MNHGIPDSVQRRRCKAHSCRTKQPCKNWAIIGGTVCRVHGGSAPQVRRRAQLRFAEARDASLEKYMLQLKRDEVPPATTMAAARDFAKTVSELEDREAHAAAASVVDDWLASLREKS